MMFETIFSLVFGVKAFLVECEILRTRGQLYIELFKLYAVVGICEDLSFSLIKLEVKLFYNIKT